MASAKRDVASEIISASVVDLLVAVCRLVTRIKGNHVFGPARAREPPDVEREASGFPQRSASTNNNRRNSFGMSFTLPIRR